MALAPKFAGAKFVAGSKPQALHTIEFFLDYVCPFSKKQFDTFYDEVFPVIKQKYAGKVEVVFRQQIQPWHPASTLVHEAGVAVLQQNPDKFWDFSKALFGKQTEYFDESLVNEGRNDTYKRLAKLASSVGLDEHDIYKRLEITAGPGKNTGNGVTNDLKLLIKHNRLQGNHVTPTVFFNGYPDGGISSSFSKGDWEKWLEKNIV